jgi:hypothetical protein
LASVYSAIELQGVVSRPSIAESGTCGGGVYLGQKPLMYTGARYAGRHFQVIVRGKHQWKGLRGEVIRDYNGPKRGSDLAKWMSEFNCTESSSVVDPRKGGEDASWKKYQEEIFVTIKEIRTNNTVSSIPLKLVYHEPCVLYASRFSCGLISLKGRACNCLKLCLSHRRGSTQWKLNATCSGKP